MRPFARHELPVPSQQRVRRNNRRKIAQRLSTQSVRSPGQSIRDPQAARSFGTFTRWFDCQFHSTLLDVADEPLMTEQV
jgi:hypothetical protein